MPARRGSLALYLVLAAITAGFVAHAVALNFTQDDAFISYRYARNLIEGKGLVFNPGERVEGYTNFLWIMLLASFGGLGANMVTVSKVLGVASGAGAIVLAFAITRLVMRPGGDGGVRRDGRDGRLRWFGLVPAALLASNGAFAYWAVSGLETSFFVMTVLAAVCLYLVRARTAFVAAAIATLTRPEGALVFAIILADWALAGGGSRRVRLSAITAQLGGFLVLVAPFIIFRIAYYHDILPNPFYAKTGFSIDYLKSGLTYFGTFLGHYGFWGALYLAPLALARPWTAGARLAAALLYAYTLYVILIGGDVLRADRFFLPVLPFGYALAAMAIARLDSALGRLRPAAARARASRPGRRAALAAGAVIALCALTFLLPRSSLLETRRYEVGLNFKMQRYARVLTRAFGRNFTLAASTIGEISYLTDVTVIDMLGLTDRYIARHPEHIAGIGSSWRERSFNVTYLLSRDPDVILFSTGMRPSAPAEKALFLASKFRENYYPYYFGSMSGVVFKRKGPYGAPNIMFPDPAFVGVYAEALKLGAGAHDYRACISKLEEAIKLGPQSFARPIEYMGTCYLLLGDTVQAEQWARHAAALDDYSIEAHSVLGRIYLARGDSASAREETAKILRYDPERLEKPEIGQARGPRPSPAEER